MKHKKTFYTGVITMTIIAVLLLTSAFVYYLYRDMKKVEQNVFNLYQEIKTTNNKIDQFSSLSFSDSGKIVNFSEVTKNWYLYQNDDFHFHLKYPSNWGELNFFVKEDDAKEKVSRLLGGFTELKDDKKFNIEIINYDLILNENNLFFKTNQQIYNLLENHILGECSADIFEQMQELNVGEIRNCYVNSNILDQKYLVFRYFLDTGTETINKKFLIYPQENFYLKIELPQTELTDFDYFIQSIVFVD